MILPYSIKFRLRLWENLQKFHAVVPCRGLCASHLLKQCQAITGRNYNIYPARNRTYSMKQEAEITVKIPAAIYKAGREYKMVCVTKGGQPVVLEDLDENPETITCRTNKFFAFALIYK